MKHKNKFTEIVTNDLSYSSDRLTKTIDNLKAII